jgi:hypothetical protein
MVAQPKLHPEHKEPKVTDPTLTDLSKRDWLAILVRAGKAAMNDHVTNLAAALAYYGFLAIFPLLLLSINSSGLETATHLPGFPTSSYFQFALAIAFVQGALFSSNSAGTNVASDIESGFLSRLSLTPLH